MFIILKNIVPLPDYPHAVVGQSGITYGHAMFDPLYQAHIFRMPYEEWAGEKGKDIASRAQGSMNRYHILVELFEGHILAPATQLASDLQDALSQLTSVRQENERLVQAAAVVDTSEPADRRLTETPVIELASQDSLLARELANAERNVQVQAPAQGLPEAPTNVDDAAAGFLVATKNGLPLEEKRVEIDPETGGKVLVEREATPPMSGVPSQPVGEVPVTPYVNVHETRTPLDADGSPSNLVEAAKTADTGKPVLDEDRVAQESQTIEEREAAKDPVELNNIQAQEGQGVANNTPPATSDDKQPDDLDAITNFRILRAKAKEEGASSEDITEAKTNEDLRALIRLTREAKTKVSE